jgi:hypothetical protein
VGPKSKRERKRGLTHRDTKGGGRSGDWSDAATSQGMPGATRSWTRILLPQSLRKELALLSPHENIFLLLYITCASGNQCTKLSPHHKSLPFSAMESSERVLVPWGYEGRSCRLLVWRQCGCTFLGHSGDPANVLQETDGHMFS